MVPAEPAAALSGLSVVIDGTGNELCPIPDKPSTSVLPEAPCSIVRVPVRVPCSVGVNVTLIVHTACAATLGPQLLVCANSPLTLMPAIATGTFVLFANVTVFAALVVAMGCAGNANAPEDNVSAGPVVNHELGTRIRNT